VVGFVSELVSNILTSVALVLGAPNLTTTLVLLGATTLVAATLVLLTRAAASDVVPEAVPGALSRTQATADVVPLVPQRDPDAAGRVRPRAPGIALG
jgi:hypothetical protein